MKHIEENFVKRFDRIESMHEEKLHASAINRIDRIQNIPLFILKAENDPITGPDGIDEERILENPNVILGKTKYGGHLGYFESFTNSNQFHNEPIFMFLNSFRKKNRKIKRCV